MKIVLLTNVIPPYRKGLYSEIMALVDEMQILVSTVIEKNRTWEIDHEKLNVIVQKSISYKKTWKHAGGYKDTTSVHVPYDTICQLKKVNADVVISGELGIRSLLAATYCRRNKKPLILWLTLSERTESNRKGFRRLLRKYLLNSATVLLGNGQSCERYVRALGSDKPMFFAPYTCDFSTEKTSKTEFNVPRKLLFTGLLIRRKGIQEMVDALLQWSKAYPRKNIELVIAGDGPEKTQFNRIEACNNIYLHLLGTVAYDQLEDLYREADIYLFPTLGDEWGVVVNEALSSGLPIMGSIHSQAVEEMVTPNENGWLFSPEDTHEFVDTLNTALETSDEQLAKMSLSSTKKVTAISPSKVAKTIREAIDFSLNATKW